MSNTKHTPGPWEVDRYYWTLQRRLFGDDEPEVQILGRILETEDDEREANARLIAAAPDGLAANIKARDAILDVLGTGMIGSDGLIAATLRDAMQACNAAIAKATND